MKNKWKWIVPGVLLAVVLGVLAFYHDAVYMVFRNLTMEVYQLDDSEDWSGGTAYLGIPYADVSPSDYVDIYVPNQEEPPPLYVIIHGGGFISGDANSRQAQLMYRYFRDHGFACASVNYRLAQEAPFPAAVEDCKAAIRFLRANGSRYGYNAERIAVFGESAGGYLAVMCAVTNNEEFNSLPFIGQNETGDVSAKVDVLVDYYGHVDALRLDEDLRAVRLPKLVYQIANYWLDGDVLAGFENLDSFWRRKNLSEMSEEELAVSNPYTYIKENLTEDTGLCAWLIHGDCDLTVPYLNSLRLREQLAQRLGEEQVSCRLVHGMGHASDPLYSDEELELLEEYLNDKLYEGQ